MTAELWIALITGLGVGGILTSLVNHRLGRRARDVDIAQKSVQIADVMLARLNGEVDRLDALLTEARQELDEYRKRPSEARIAEVASSIDRAEHAFRNVQQSVHAWIRNPSDAAVREDTVEAYSAFVRERRRKLDEEGN